MNKRWLIAATVAIALALGSGVARAQVSPGRIVTIDLSKVFDTYYKTPLARSKIDEAKEQLNNETKAKLDDLNKKSDELKRLKDEQERPEYTPEVRAEKSKAVSEKLGEIKRLQDEIQDYRNQHAKILEGQIMRMRQNILKEITDVVTKEAKDSGDLIVFDRSGFTMNGLPPVVFSQENIDITTDIVKILNKNAPLEAAKPAEKKPEDKK